jgi:hypothetical protein
LADDIVNIVKDIVEEHQNKVVEQLEKKLHCGDECVRKHYMNCDGCVFREVIEIVKGGANNE